MPEAQAISPPAITESVVPVDGSGLSELAMEILAEEQAAPSSRSKDGKFAKKKTETKEAKADGGGEADDASADDSAATSSSVDEAVEAEGLGDGGDDAEDSQEQPIELKVKGKVYKAKNLEDLKAMAQRGLAMQQNYEQFKRESDELRTKIEHERGQIQQLVDFVKKDPAKFLKSYNEKAVDSAEELLLERAIESERMSTMTLREKELYVQNKKYQEQLRGQEESQKQAEATREASLVQEQRQALGKVFGDALTKGKLPANETTVRIMSQIYRANLAKNVELTPDQAADLTREQLKQINSSLTDGMTAEDFVKAFPKLADGIRQHYVKQARSGGRAESQDTKRQSVKVTQRVDRADEDIDWDKRIKKLVQEGSALRVKNGW